MLSQLKKINIKAKTAAIADMMKLINFQISSSPMCTLFTTEKSLITNDFRIVYLNNVGNLSVESNLKVSEMEFIFGRYLSKTIHYIDLLL